MQKLNQIQISNITSSILTKPVVDQTTLEQATKFLSELNTSLDKLIEEKEKVTTPLNLALKNERARFKPAEQQLEDAITQVKTSITTYVNAQIAEAKLLEQKILNDMRTSATTKIDKLATIDQSATDKVATDAGSVSFVTVKKWRITEAMLIPRTYLIPNEGMIKEAMKDNTNIPGIEFYSEQTLRNYR